MWLLLLGWVVCGVVAALLARRELKKANPCRLEGEDIAACVVIGLMGPWGLLIVWLPIETD